MQCSVYIATSLDGFIARADGRIDWLGIVERGGEDYGYGVFHQSIDTIVIGRRTYETALGFDSWPYAGKRCLVLTHTPAAPQHGEEFYSEPVDQLVARLAGSARIYVDGGTVIQQFLAAGLVTDMTISIIPILLGEGARLFGTVGGDIPLRLVSSRAFESGLVQLRYELG